MSQADSRATWDLGLAYITTRVTAWSNLGLGVKACRIITSKSPLLHHKHSSPPLYYKLYTKTSYVNNTQQHVFI